MPARKAPPKEQRLPPSQQVAAVAARLGVSKPLVKSVLDAYRDYLMEQINERDDFVILDLFRVLKSIKPATVERPGYDRLHKKPTVFKAKPASVRLRLIPQMKLKGLLRLTPGS